jgi:hypothetical protein
MPTVLERLARKPEAANNSSCRAVDLEERFWAAPLLRFGSRPVALRATEPAANRRLRLYG